MEGVEWGGGIFRGCSRKPCHVPAESFTRGVASSHISVVSNVNIWGRVENRSRERSRGRPDAHPLWK